MAEEQKEEAPKAAAVTPEAAGTEVKKKKLRPTNCAQSNKRIRRKDWYYREGKYFANKQCYHLFVTQAKEKALKEAEAKPAAG